MRIANTGRPLFSVTIAGLGVLGLLRPDLVSLWVLPDGFPAARVLVALTSSINVAAGIGLLFRRIAPAAARLLLAAFLLWLLFLRLPNFFRMPAFASCWSVFPLAVMTAAAWTLYVALANSWDRRYLGLITGKPGLRSARSLYGLALIFFGAAHFIDLPDTLVLIPHWLPWHLFWAYFTGCAFIAAGLAALTGICARLAVTLSVLQLALFLVLVWIPIVAAGARDPFRLGEMILNAALMSAAWVVACSYDDPIGQRAFT